MKQIKFKCIDLPLPVIFFTLLLNALGFGILIPIIPLLLADPTSQYFMLPPSFTLGQGYIIFGFLVAIYPLMQFLATPILGQLSDKFGRKKILAISLAGTFISYILFAVGILIKNIPILFISRAFDGITGGNISVAQAVVADITTPQNRARTFGIVGAAFGIGFIIGPFLGGILSESKLLSWFNAATPFWFAAVLSFINVILIVICLAETFKLKKDKKIIWGQSVKNIIKAFNISEIRTIFITVFLFQSGFTFFTTFFSVFLITKFGFTQSNTGNFFAYLGLWLVFTQGFLTGIISKKFSEVQVLRITLVATGVFILTYLIPDVWWGLFIVAPFFAFANGLSQSNITGLISRSVGPEIQGEILGINASVAAIAQAIPAILSGFIAASLTPYSPSIVAACVIILGGIIFISAYKQPVLNKYK
jgi:DHA1 family tetracycline resistance protein-like MFS transporter